MSSIFSKIVIWAIGMIVLSLVGVFATSRILDMYQPRHVDFISRTLALQVEGARRAFEEGGRGRLAAYLQRLDELFEAEHTLIDADGRDLVTGTDRSALLNRATTPPRPPSPIGGRFMIASKPEGKRARLLVLVPPFRGPGTFLPYYLWILLVIGVFGYALALHLARPLRRLRDAVDRFGHGDLATRIGSKRRDEIGELGRAFDLMAERIDSLMTSERRLLQDVSHELRSPLARLGFAVALARSNDDRDAAMDRIQKDVDRLSTLVDELLHLYSAEGDPQTRQVEDVPLDELLGALVDDCVLEAEAKDCRLEFHAEHPVVVQGDRELLHRAFENALRNAIRHAPERTPIEIDVRVQADSASISIRDHGPGVPEPMLDAIFEPFQRVARDRSRSSGGVGLGLSIARRAIELHRGRVQARNAHPGLRVTFTLPDALTRPRPDLEGLDGDRDEAEALTPRIP